MLHDYNVKPLSQGRNPGQSGPNQFTNLESKISSSSMANALTDATQASGGQSLEVEFIQYNLPKYHAYYGNPDTRYDEQSRRYVAKTTVPSTVLPVVSQAPASNETKQLENSAPGVMTYWNMIFPSAMEKFRLGCTTPSCEQPVRDIAGLRTWTEVYDKLRLARDTYTELTGTTGRLRRVWRWTADNIVEPARLATKVVPQMDIVTPVLGAVLIILEAIKKGAEVRKETLRAFDDLEDVFADVEVFLETFQNERSVIDHAIALVVAVLEAVVRAVRFFTRPGLIRGLKSIVKGKDYEAPLLESLTAITTRSKSLMAWAVKTHIRDFAQYSNATRRIHQLILNNQEHIAIRVDLVHAGVDEVSSQNRFIISQNERSKNVQDGMNATLALLMDKHEETKRELHFLRSQNREQQKILAAGQREISRLGDIIVRSVSPLPGSAKSSGLHPPPPLQHSAQSYFQEHDGFCQGDLWALLRVPYDIEIADADDIEEKREHLAAVDRARMEQIVHTQKFQQWIISPDSTKLLIHGNLSPVRSMETSSLSLFCATLAKAFRSRPRYLCLVWFCGRHIGNTGDSDDESDVESRFDGLDYDDSSSDEYHHHCSSFHRNEVHQDARTKKGTIRRMVQSLIGQLLSDHDFGLSYSLVPSADVALIEDGDLEELALLLRWLVQQLPEEVTLVFLIDGIIFYEREEFEGPMLDILGDILGFTATNDISATVKVLVTSPWPTTTVRTAFQEGHPGDDTGWPSGGRDSILSTEMIQLSQVDTSMDRLNRELQELGAEDI